jgi:hypothetical protein
VKFLDRKVKFLDRKVKFLDRKVKFLDRKVKFLDRKVKVQVVDREIGHVVCCAFVLLEEPLSLRCGCRRAMILMHSGQ